MIKKEATIALCKCKETHKIYGVRFEKTSTSSWKYTWAYPIKEAVAKREGYDGTVIIGDIEPDDEYPGCPYCGAKFFVVCSCGKLNCNVGNVKRFICEWCGLSGALIEYDGFGIKSGGDR